MTHPPVEVVERRSPYGERGLKYIPESVGATVVFVALLTESVD